MPTLYRRMLHYCATHKRKRLNLEQKKLLGEQIRSNYFPAERESKLIKLPPHSIIEQKEPEGTFTVISYPKAYNPTIDRMIGEFYASIPAPPPRENPKPKPPRKRIPIATTKVFTSTANK